MSFYYNKIKYLMGCIRVSPGVFLALFAVQFAQALTWRSRPIKQGLVPVGGPAARLADLIRLEMERWPRVVAGAGIKAD